MAQKIAQRLLAACFILSVIFKTFAFMLQFSLQKVNIASGYIELDFV
jgi:hypothetical protein